MKTDLFKKLHTPADAKAWLEEAIKYLGLGFHPDTSGHDYVNSKTGAATFTCKQGNAYDRAREQVFELLKDPYATAYPHFRRRILAQARQAKRP